MVRSTVTMSGCSVADNLMDEERGGRTDRLYHSSINKKSRARLREGAVAVKSQGIEVNVASGATSAQLGIR